MNHPFSRPIFVRDGKITFMIEDIPSALAFMDNWPAKYRGVVYDTIRWGLYVTMQGQMSISTIERIFQEWARAHGILEQKLAIVSTSPPEHDFMEPDQLPPPQAMRAGFSGAKVEAAASP